MSTKAGGKRLELVRGLGPWASAAIVVGTMIGTGIFLKPAEMAREGRFVSIVFAAWIVGAILSMFGALSFAELGAAIPEAGGEYAYLRRGFGPRWGFLFRVDAFDRGTTVVDGVNCGGYCAIREFLDSGGGGADFHAAFSSACGNETVRIRFYLGAASGRAVADYHDAGELPGSAARRSGAGGVDDRKNCFRIRRHWRGLLFGWKSAHAVRPDLAAGTGQRDPHGISCRSRRSVVGLRRLGGFESRRVRSGEAAEKFPTRVVGRRIAGGDCLLAL